MKHSLLSAKPTITSLKCHQHLTKQKSYLSGRDFKRITHFIQYSLKQKLTLSQEVSLNAYYAALSVHYYPSW